MCESSAFILGKDNQLEKIMENVIQVCATDFNTFVLSLSNSSI